MKSRVNRQQLRTIDDIRRQREIMQLHVAHNKEILNRDLDVIKANLVGVKIVGELAKKAVSYVEDRFFDIDEDDLLYDEPHDVLQQNESVGEVNAIDQQED